MNKRLLLLLFASFFVINLYADPVPPATNKDGSLVSGVLEAAFNPADPVNPVLPFPTNLFFPTAPPIDLTVGLPAPDPDDYTNPRVALNSLDGFSTTEKWVTTFTQSIGGAQSTQPGDIDPASVVAGQSVRVFEVTTPSYPWLGVAGVVRELLPNLEYAAALAPGGVLAIVPIMPLKQLTTYMAVLTNDINDTRGNDATPSQVYHLAKTRTPLVDENGNSTVPLLPDSTAQALEPLRQATMSMELSAASAGVNPADIVLSWTVRTQSITPTLKLMRSIAQPAPTIIAPTGMNTAAVGGFGLADIYMGVITLPYYLGAPSMENPTAPLTDFWKAEPGAYIPPFDQIPFLDPTSTNITVANPFPALTGMQTVPLLITAPSANSGFTKPEGGWPVVIFGHGLTRNRTDMLAIADAVAQTGRVVVAMDGVLHGVVPDVDPQLAPFYIENTPFAPIANERTFDADYWNAAEGTLGQDGLGDQSGLWAVNPANLQATRDNARQTAVDHSVLALSLQNMDLDGDANPDLNAFDVSFACQSAGCFLTIPFASVEPIVSRVYLNVTGGGIFRSLNAGYFGPNFLQPFLESLAGLVPGTAEYEQYLLAAQTVVDSADSINWGAEAAARMPVIHNQVMQDDTVPNVVPGAPLAGSEALNRVMGLAGYSTTQMNPDGLNGVARFIQPAEHGSWLRPESYPAVTAEMQGQMASFIASGGTAVVVGNPDLLVPVAAPAASKAAAGKNKAGPVKSKNQRKPVKSAKNLGVNDHD
ncbi:hypothetical protein ACFL07_06115 [Pseudomonadota bacterium]